jgi:hypothetical protein
VFEGVVEKWTIIKQAIRTDAIRDVRDEAIGINDFDSSVVRTIVSIELPQEGEVLHGGWLQLLGPLRSEQYWMHSRRGGQNSRRGKFEDERKATKLQRKCIAISLRCGTAERTAWWLGCSEHEGEAKLRVNPYVNLLLNLARLQSTADSKRRCAIEYCMRKSVTSSGALE